MTSSVWPAVGRRTYAWPRAAEPGQASRTQRKIHAGPYEAALLEPIARLSPVLPSAVIAAAEDASAEIARFDQDMGHEIAPFATVLLRSESAASSQIEDLTASARAIAEAEIGAGSRTNAAQVLANVTAMNAALSLSNQLDAHAILAMHGALMNDIDPINAGRWRTEQVWIGGRSLGPHSATFVPPHDRDVIAAIDDLVAFVARDDIPLLAHAAIVHAQFETIHPFTDGNGRTGRALLHAMLRGKGLIRNVTVPVSAGLLVDVEGYFDALGAYRRGDPAPMVSALTDASFAAIANGRQLVEDLRGIRAGWDLLITARRDSAVWRVADFVVRHPVIDAKFVTEKLGIAGGNVHRHTTALEDAGVLEEFTSKKRNRAWRAPQVLSALDDFAARAGRRTRP